MVPLRRRILPLLGVFLGAPVAAEYLQAYLPFTGELWASLFGIVFFAPLYGGAALLIREVAVRTDMGWPGTLLLAAAFGVAMTGIIDLSKFGEERPDVPYWAELREPTLIEPLGVSVAATLSWTAGHVMMSVGAPLALLYALAPRTAGGRCSGRSASRSPWPARRSSHSRFIRMVSMPTGIRSAPAGRSRSSPSSSCSSSWPSSSRPGRARGPGPASPTPATIPASGYQHLRWSPGPSG